MCLRCKESGQSSSTLKEQLTALQRQADVWRQEIELLQSRNDDLLCKLDAAELYSYSKQTAVFVCLYNDWQGFWDRCKDALWRWVRLENPHMTAEEAEARAEGYMHNSFEEPLGDISTAIDGFIIQTIRDTELRRYKATEGHPKNNDTHTTSK